MSKKKKPNALFNASDGEIKKDNDLDGKNIVSYTECTGLIQAPPQTREQSQYFSDLYNIHRNAAQSVTVNKKRKS